MSTSEPQPDDARTAELVAYLDGELPDDAARRVEKQLATDDGYRQQLGELDRAWSALEVLPTATVDDKFARTTIEMVALAAQQDLNQRTAVEKSEARRRTLWQIAAALAVIAVGFAIGRMLLPSQNRVLISELPIVARIDELTHIGDVDFLRELVKLDLPQLVSEDESRQRQQELNVPDGGWDGSEARRQWVEHLSADQKEELAGRLQRFENLSGEEQRKVRDLEREIFDAKDSAVLLKTLDAYGEWLSTRSQATQAELRGLAPIERLDRVRAIVARGNRQYGRRLTAEEEQALREALAKFTDDHRDELLKEMPREGGPRENGGPPRDSSWWRRPENGPLANMLIAWRAISDEKFRDELHKQLTAALSPANREYFDGLTQIEQMQQMAQWVRAATNLRIDPKALERFFVEKLSSDQREVLMNLPQQEMQNRLERWYAASQFGIPEQKWSSFEPPRGMLGRGGPGGPGFGRRDRDDGQRGRGDGPPPGGEGRRRFRGPGDGPPDGPPPGGPPGRPPGDRPRQPPPSDSPDDPPPGPPPR